METYEVTLVVDRLPTETELESIPTVELDEAGMVAFETSDEGVLAHLAIEAANLPAAIAYGMHHTERLGRLALQVVGVASNDLVSLKDIAARTGRTYESVRLLATGKRGPGRFPAAMSTGQWALYSWAEVSTWLAEHYDTDAAGTFDRQIAAADHLIRARRILADDDHRTEMAKLLAA